MGVRCRLRHFLPIESSVRLPDQEDNMVISACSWLTSSSDSQPCERGAQPTLLHQPTAITVKRKRQPRHDYGSTPADSGPLGCCACLMTVF
ncbi:hypothetical protein BDW71DRAFT_30698 [Aspergillus fruticulosus]